LNDSAFDAQLEGVYFGMWNGSIPVRCFVSHEALTDKAQGSGQAESLDVFHEASGRTLGESLNSKASFRILAIVVPPYRPPPCRSPRARQHLGQTMTVAGRPGMKGLPRERRITVNLVRCMSAVARECTRSIP
jgi:hypothetical protein